MNTAKQAAQLRLAAEIVEKGLEWERNVEGEWLPPGPGTPAHSIIWNEEIRIKPWTLGRSINGFTLGDGQEWHRQDFKKWMLEDSVRPLLLGEKYVKGETIFYVHGEEENVVNGIAGSSADKNSSFGVTRRPLPPVIPEGFTPWSGGVYAPVAKETKVEVVWNPKVMTEGFAKTSTGFAVNWRWDNIIAYRVVEPARVPWSCPEDVPGPVCWIRASLGFPRLVTAITDKGICVSCVNGRDNPDFFDWQQCSEVFEYSTDRKTWHPCTKEVTK